MTVRGILCLILDLFVLLLALGSGIRELLLIALFVLLFLGYSLLSLLLACLTLRAKGSLDTVTVDRGEPVNYSITVSGRVVLPLAGHMVILPPGIHNPKSRLKQQHAFFLFPSVQEIRKTYQLTLPCSHRGCWQVAPRGMYLTDIFGFCSLRMRRYGIRQPAPVSLEVFPCVHTLHLPREIANRTNGFAASQVRDSLNGELFGDTRQYQPGDPIKRIHWKQTARTRELHIRQFEAQENPQTLILLDTACRSKNKEAMADIATETAASLGQYMINHDKTIRIQPLRSSAQADSEDGWVRGAGDFDRFIRLLTHLPFTPADGDLSADALAGITPESSGTVVLISDCPSVEVIRRLVQLRDSGHTVACFLPDPGQKYKYTPEMAEQELLPVILTTAEEISEKTGVGF